jgi:hypothetical protein
MAAKYSAASGLKQGLQETFDGEHPCEFCRALQASKQAEDEGPPPARDGSKKNGEKAVSERPVWALAAARSWAGCPPEGPPPRLS